MSLTPPTPVVRPFRRFLTISLAIVVFVVLINVPLPFERDDADAVLLSASARQLLALTTAMAVLWFTEAIPVAATALVPVAAYPLLGIASAKDAAGPYVNHLTFLFLGGLLIAIAIEQWHVHRRIALRVMIAVGTSPRALTIGLMVVSAGLSMWISNTATSMLLLPIGLALFDELDDLGTKDDDSREGLAVALLLAIAYGANCGGLATPVGTPTNATLLGFWSESTAMSRSVPSLGEWIVVALPFAFAMLACVAVVLTFGLPKGSGMVDRSFLRDRLCTLGAPSGGAMAVLAVFVITAAAWVTRGEIQAYGSTIWPGWQVPVENQLSDLFRVDVSGKINDSTVAIAAGVLLFILVGRKSDGSWAALLEWNAVEKRVPWGVLLLFGSGFTIASAFESTGLADWTGHVAEAGFSGAPPVAIIAGSVALVTFLTEFTTNVATISTLLPVLVASAVRLGIDPVLVAVPATLAASCAFMLPIATPPNAVVFGSGRVPLQRMIRTGVVLNLVSIALLTGLAVTWLPAVLGSE